MTERYIPYKQAKPYMTGVSAKCILLFLSSHFSLPYPSLGSKALLWQFSSHVYEIVPVVVKGEMNVAFLLIHKAIRVLELALSTSMLDTFVHPDLRKSLF